MVLTADCTEPFSGSEKRPIGEIYGLIAELDWQTGQAGPYHPRTIEVAHRLSIAFWCKGEINRAVSILDQALNGLASSPEPDHPVRLDVLNTLAEILVEQSQWEHASLIYREVLDLCIRRSGENHSSSLAAKGDLAMVLFELGQTHEATLIESQAYEGARLHLGRTHPVSCVLAWNRALRFETNGDADTARSIVVGELAWLLAQADDTLAADQQMIRTMLAKRLNWGSARIC
jgi:tetratricopeptide (TPR) repeat protein